MGNHNTSSSDSAIEWRQIPGYNGMYEASNSGLIRRTRMHGRYSPGPLAQSKHTAGYLTVALSIKGKQRTLYIHRLVMLAFFGKSALDVNHIDGDKTNNRLSNLEYVSRKENTRHAAEVLKMDYTFKGGANRYDSRGVNHGQAKLNDEKVREIRLAHANGVHIDVLVATYGVCKSVLYAAIRRKTWRHVD